MIHRRTFLLGAIATITMMARPRPRQKVYSNTYSNTY